MIYQILLTLLSGWLYWVGGQDKTKIKWANTKIRDLGVPTVWLISMILLKGWSSWYLLCFMLLFGSLTTYWKKKGEDAQWYNWLFTGLGYSLAIFPFVIVNDLWVFFAVRTVILTVFVTLWSTFMGADFWQENGRGGMVVLTNSLLTIGGLQ